MTLLHLVLPREAEGSFELNEILAKLNISTSWAFHSPRPCFGRQMEIQLQGDFCRPQLLAWALQHILELSSLAFNRAQEAQTNLCLEGNSAFKCHRTFLALVLNCVISL